VVSKQLPKHILVMTVSFVLASSGDMFRKSTIGFEAGILTVSDLTKAHGVGAVPKLFESMTPLCSVFFPNGTPTRSN